MIIKNQTKFNEKCLEGAMRASNFDNNRYKMFKLIYNLFGLLFGMMLVRYLVLGVWGSKDADTFMTVFYAIATAVFLYIGMVGMDRNNKKKFHNIYGKMIGVTFTYDIDAEQIVVTDEDNDKDYFLWEDIQKWAQDEENIYLFVSSDDCLVISKTGFTEGKDSDLKELVTAIIGLRNEENKENS